MDSHIKLDEEFKDAIKESSGSNPFLRGGKYRPPPGGYKKKPNNNNNNRNRGGGNRRGGGNDTVGYAALRKIIEYNNRHLTEILGGAPKYLDVSRYYQSKLEDDDPQKAF